MQMQRERRSVEQRSPPAQGRGAPFDIFIVEAMPMMTEVRRLDRMHCAHHRHTQREHGEVCRLSAESECVVIGVVDLAKTGEEEEKSAGERERRKRSMTRCREMPSGQ